MANGEGVGASGPNWAAIEAGLAARLASRFIAYLAGDDAARKQFAEELAKDALAAMQAGKPALILELSAQARVRGEALRLRGTELAWSQVSGILGDVSMVGLQLAPLLL